VIVPVPYPSFPVVSSRSAGVACVCPVGWQVSRTLRLPVDATTDPGTLAAEYKDGVLRVTVPKARDEGPKRKQIRIH
jgi:hypothetical protein